VRLVRTNNGKVRIVRGHPTDIAARRHHEPRPLRESLVFGWWIDRLSLNCVYLGRCDV
jgi:hypothetical protein